MWGETHRNANGNADFDEHSNSYTPHRNYTKLNYDLEIFRKYAGMKKSVRVYAFDDNKSPVITVTAKYDEKTRTWYWEQTTLNDFTDLLSNLLHKDYTFGANFVVPNTLPEYRKMIKHHFNGVLETWSARMDIFHPDQNEYVTRGLNNFSKSRI